MSINYEGKKKKRRTTQHRYLSFHWIFIKLTGKDIYINQSVSNEKAPVSGKRY